LARRWFVLSMRVESPEKKKEIKDVGTRSIMGRQFW
jgi:hypothetical protein